MKMVMLHDMNNPTQKKFLVVENFCNVEPLGSGSAVKVSDSDVPLLVHETPEEVDKIIEEKNNE